MKEKIIKIPFNSSCFLESHKVLWGFSARKNFARNLTFTMLAGFCFAVSLMFEHRGEIPLDTMLIGGYFFYMIMFWVGHFERRVKYFNKVRKQALHFEEEAMETTFIFSDNGFEYIDKERSFQLSWMLFKPITFYKENILLFLEDGGVMFSISRSELADTDYDELCNILEEKTGNS